MMRPEGAISPNPGQRPGNSGDPEIGELWSSIGENIFFIKFNIM